MYLKAIDSTSGREAEAGVHISLPVDEGLDLKHIPWPDLEDILCNYDRDIEREIMEVRFKNGKVVKNLVKVKRDPVAGLMVRKSLERIS